MADGPEWSEDPRQSKKITGIIEKTLECPVCLELARPPVQQCSRGHIVCSSCVDKMTTKICPLCSKSFSLETSTCMNNLLEVLPRQCKYSTLGCKEVYVSVDDEEHEDYCGFRSITCRECNTKILVNNIKKHYKVNHANRNFIVDRQQRMLWAEFDPYKDKNVNTPVSINDHFFYIALKNDTKERNLKITCDAFYIGKPKINDYVTVKFENKSFVQQKTIQPIVVKGEHDADGFSLISKTDENTNEFCMHVPQKFLSHFVNSSKQLVQSYTFFTM